MATRTKVTSQKRNRERARQEAQKEKARRRAVAKEQKANTPRRSGDEDPTWRASCPARSPTPGPTRTSSRTTKKRRSAAHATARPASAVVADVAALTVCGARLLDQPYEVSAFLAALLHDLRGGRHREVGACGPR